VPHANREQVAETFPGVDLGRADAAMIGLRARFEDEMVSPGCVRASHAMQCDRH
jgi:hypothetical protein